MEELIKKLEVSKNCADHKTAVDAWLSQSRNDLFEEMKHDEGDCPCSGGEKKLVDLVVLIDSSTSMYKHWLSVSAAAPKAFELARGDCGGDPRVDYFFLDVSDSGTNTMVPPPGMPAGTVFSKSHETYLSTIGVSGPFAADGDGFYDAEQGAKAVMDISRHYDWRKNACRAVLYISDERLDSISKTLADSSAAVNAAIPVAIANGVTVFTHYLPRNGANTNAGYIGLDQHYRDLAEKTGGKARIEAIGASVTVETYVELIKEAICGGCGSCPDVEWPEIEPCFHIEWADSTCDCIETDDHERLLITASNCYGNVTFDNLSIGAIYLVDEDGNPPQDLPDGSPSGRIYPLGPICFGEVGPCDGEPTSVSREAVIINRGLKPGNWRIVLSGICFSITRSIRAKNSVHYFEACKS